MPTTHQTSASNKRKVAAPVIAALVAFAASIGTCIEASASPWQPSSLAPVENAQPTYEPRTAQLSPGPSRSDWLAPSALDSGYTPAIPAPPSQPLPSQQRIPPGYQQPYAPAFIPPPPGSEEPPRQAAPASQANTEAARLENEAVTALTRKQWRKAERLLLQLLQLDPSRRQVRMILANLMLKLERPQDAIYLLASPGMCSLANDSEMQLLLGRAQLQAGDAPQAINTFRQVLSHDPATPDGNLLLGSAYLQNEMPLAAWPLLSSGANSNREAAQLQQMALATALAQLGQVASAQGLLQKVYNDPASESVAKSAWENQRSLNEAIYQPSRLYGALKSTVRYDTNTGVLPTNNLFGVAGGEIDSFGTLSYANVNYDLWRSYQSTLTAGYTGLFTRNFKDQASPFDLNNHSCYLGGNHRTLGPIHQLPCVYSLRADYDNVASAGTSFLQRAGLSAAISVIDSDYTRNTFQVRYTTLDFLNQAIGVENSILDPDSSSYEATLTRQWQNAKRDLTWQVGYIFNRNESQGTQFDYIGNRLFVGANYELPRDALLGANFQYFHRSYDNVQLATGTMREDSELLLAVQYTRPLMEDILFIAEWAYDLNESNVARNSYDRSVVEAGVQWNFGTSGR